MADGRRKATCGNALDIWDVSADGKVALVAQAPVGDCSAIAMSSDGHLAAVATGNLVMLYDAADPHRPRRFAPLAGPTLGADQLAFSPDGQTLAIGAADGSLRPALVDEIPALGGSVLARCWGSLSPSSMAATRLRSPSPEAVSRYAPQR